MGLVIVEDEKREYEPVPEETYVGNCIGIFDIGNQYNEKYKVYRRQAILMWEIPDVRAKFEFEGTDYDYPRVVSRKFGLTLSKRGHLRPMLERWRGSSFGVGEKVELKSFLGKAALIQVVHNVTGPRIYANVGNVSKLLKGMEEPKPETPLMFFSFDEHETLESAEEALQDFPSWVVWVVKAARVSTEYENLQKRSLPIEETDGLAGQFPDLDDDEGPPF